MIGALAIAAGYALLVWQFGWWGLAAGAAHVGVMVLATWRRDKP